jgi:hypothetical protein
MVVLLSPEATQSELVQREIDFALGSLQFKDRLVSVLVRPTEDIPWILRKLPFIRGLKNPSKIADRILDHLQPAAV